MIRRALVSADRTEFLDWVAQADSDGPGRRYSYDVDAKTYHSAQSATTSLVLTIDNDTGATHAAHPATAFKSFTYDLAKKKPVTTQ